MRVGLGLSGAAWPVRQAVVAGSLVIIILVGISFARVMVREYQLGQQKQALEANVAQLKQQNKQLEDQFSYLQSDAAIEKLAREELGWTKPGDTAVVILRANDAPSPVVATAKSAVPTKQESRWSQWWDQIRGDLNLGG